MPAILSDVTIIAGDAYVAILPASEVLVLVPVLFLFCVIPDIF